MKRIIPLEEIPADVLEKNREWQDKRKEYHSQYYMGVKYPKLSPINHPELKIMKTDKSLTTPKVNSIDQKAEALFGKALIRKEGE